MNAQLQRALADARQVQAAAIITKLHRDVVTGLLHPDTDQADTVLATRGAFGLRLDTMHHAVAHQVLEGRRHALQDAAVDFDRPADDVQPHLLAGLLAGLAHHAVQALGNAVELHHARAQQLALQLTRLARLRGQVVLAALDRPLQAALHRGHVVDRLRHHAGELLHAGEAVEFQWIEVLLRILGQRQARLHLRLGLQLDIAQLRAQAIQVARQLAQQTAQLADLGLQPRTRSRHLAGLQHQAVQQLRAHAHRLAGGGARRHQ